MDFGANKPIEVTKKGAFGKTYFRDVYSGVNGKRYRKSSWTILVCKNLFLLMLRFLGRQFCNTFFEGAILKCTHVLKCIFWDSNYFNFLIHDCCLWLVHERQINRWKTILRIGVMNFNWKKKKLLTRQINA